MLPAQLDYAAPATLAEAVALLASHPDAQIASYRAIIDLKMRRIAPGLLVDLRKIPELRGITAEGDGIRLGAMATLGEIGRAEMAQSALIEAAEASGDPQMRNMETLGASLTYDAPVSDVAAALLALDAVIQVAGADGERKVAASEFFASGLARAEIVTAVSLPASSGRSAYEKFSHPATLVPICGVAVRLTTDANATVQRCVVAVTGATDHPQRVPGAESALQGQQLDEDSIAQAASAAGDGLEFVADLDASAEYRAHLLQVLLKRALGRAV